MIVATVKETYAGETRVALTPPVLAPLIKKGAEILIEAGAGEAAGYPDAAYTEKGATIVASRDEIFQRADVIAQIRGLGTNDESGQADVARLRKDQLLICTFDPLVAHDAVKTIAGTGAALFALELVPRITRAQSMDILSSMATIAGYKGVLLAAEHLPKMFPMMMTAAGTVTPAKVMILGAGVAGLQAIASSRRLGAQVEAYDIRPAVAEQIQSLGAKFVELDLDTGEAEDKGGYAKAMGEEFYVRQRAALAKVFEPMDVIISTAAIPGRQAPLLITEDAVKGMQPGSVIVDLAAETGGNCELTKAGETVVAHGVTILGPANLAATVPFHASQMFSKNVVTFLLNMVDKEGNLNVDPEDEVVAGSLVTQHGEIVHPRVRDLMGLPALQPADPA